MTDKEMLEWAAKAAGAIPDPNVENTPPGLYFDADGQDYIFAVNSNDDWHIWRPLTDDGDALRLAVRLRLWVRWREDSEVNVCWYDERGIFAGNFTEHGDDLDAATRRAIVRAAAEIGKAMEG